MVCIGSVGVISGNRFSKTLPLKNGELFAGQSRCAQYWKLHLSIEAPICLAKVHAGVFICPFLCSLNYLFLLLLLIAFQK